MTNAIVGEPCLKHGRVSVQVQVDGFGLQTVTHTGSGSFACAHPEASVCRIAIGAVRNWVALNPTLAKKYLVQGYS